MKVFKLCFKIGMSYKMVIFQAFAILLVMSFLFAGNTSASKDQEYDKANYYVENLDKGEFGQVVMNYLDEHTNLQDAAEYGAVDIKDVIFLKQASVAVQIPEDFSEKLMQGDVTLHTNIINMDTDVALTNNALQDYLRLMVQTYQLDTTQSASEVADIATDVSKAVSTSEIVTTKADEVTTVGYNAQIFDFSNYIFLVCATSIILVLMKRILDEGTLQRMTSSSLSIKKLLLGIYGASFAIMIVMYIAAVAVLQLFGYSIFDATYQPHFVVMFFSTITATSLSLMVGFIFHKKMDGNMRNIVSNVLSLATSFLCGIFVPTRLLSPTIQTLGKFLPYGWLTKINADLQTSSIFSSEILTSFGIVTLFILVFVIIGYYAFRLQRQGEEI